MAFLASSYRSVYQPVLFLTMGACKSRQTKSQQSTENTAKLETPLITTDKKTGPYQLRRDVRLRVGPELIVPEDPDEVKEPWELFLDQKKQDYVTQQRGLLRRTRDGTYTAEYKSLLARAPARGRSPARSPSPERWREGRNFDLQNAWRAAQKRGGSPSRGQAEAKVLPKKRKPTQLKKAILASRESPETNALWQQFEAHMQKVKAMNDETETTTAAKVADLLTGKVAQDDSVASKRLVPFGLSDRCYHSDTEDTKLMDQKKSSRHKEDSHAPIREYVNMELTPELEESVTETLFTLRSLRMQELGLGQKSRRYAVGFREVGRLVTQKAVQCLIVAPDVERTGGALEDKISQLVAQCEGQNVPVVYALSRRQLGRAVMKNVTVSVLAIEDVRGANEIFSRMLHA